MHVVWRRMDGRPRDPGGVNLYAVLLVVLLLGRALVAGSLPTSESLPRATSVETTETRTGFETLIAESPDTDTESVSDCILIQLGVQNKGTLGDVIQPAALTRLLASVVPPNQCFWYAHPWVEDATVRGRYTAHLSNGDISRSVPISTGYAEEVNRFKALVVGVGGFFTTKYKTPLVGDFETFSQHLALPVIIMGAAASYHAKQCGTILKKAAFVSGRDVTSTKVLADVVHRGPASAVQVPDPVLSDTFLTDTEGKCWEQSAGAHQQPLCFVLPASNKPSNVEMHRQLADEVVTPEDIFVSILPKNRSDNKLLRSYPGEVQHILDPAEFTERLCSCRAILSADFTAAVLGLHMGVPTIGVFRDSPSNEVRELMVDTMRLPDQFVVVDEHLSRAGLNYQVKAVRRRYARRGRRESIRDLLSAFRDDFESYAQHVLFGIIGVQHKKGSLPAGEHDPVSSLWAPAYAGADDGPIVREPARRHDAADLQGPPLAAALLAGADVSKLPQDAVVRPSGGLDVEKKVIDHAATAMEVDHDHHHHARDTGLLSTVKKRRSAYYGDATGHGELMVKLITNTYTTAIFLVAAIAVISLTLQPSSVKSVPKDDFFGEAEDVTYVQSDGGSRTSSDSDLTTFPELSPTSRTVRGRSARATAGAAAATSSKMTFMFNFAMWVSLAMGFSSYGKTYLGDTHDPIGLLILQGATGVLVLCVLALCGVLGKDLTPVAVRQAGLAAVLHTGQALLANFALLAGGVAVTNALKAMKPAAAAVFSYLLLGKTCSGSRMAALATIVVGILILTCKGNNAGGDGGYIVISAVFTMAAVCCNALRNVVIKRGNPIPPHQTLFTCSAAATAVGITLMLLRLTFWSMDGLLQRGGSGHGGYDGRDLVSSWVRMDGVNAALCFVGYNLASFNLLLRLSPVGHAVGNSCKDVLVSAGGLMLLGEVMSARQLGGTAVALAGVLAYNVTGSR